MSTKWPKPNLLLRRQRLPKCRASGKLFVKVPGDSEHQLRPLSSLPLAKFDRTTLLLQLPMKLFEILFHELNETDLAFPTLCSIGQIQLSDVEFGCRLLCGVLVQRHGILANFGKSFHDIPQNSEAHLMEASVA